MLVVPLLGRSPVAPNPAVALVTGLLVPGLTMESGPMLLVPLLGKSPVAPNPAVWLETVCAETEATRARRIELNCILCFFY